MAIIEFLQSFSNAPLDYIMRALTEFGDVMFFIVLGAVLFWSVDKKFAFKLMTTLLFSATINGGIKHYTNKNRPYQDGAKPILQETEGSSMPSGHAQNIFTASTIMVHEYRKVNWVKWTFIALALIVPLTRMYLGQHYLEDVLVGMLLGLLIGILGIFVYQKFPHNEEYVALAAIPIIVLMMIFIHEKQVFVSGGAFLGLALGYFIEKKKVRFETKAKLSVQIYKILIGLAVAILLLEGLKVLFGLIDETNLILIGIRYFAVAFWASLGAPALFKVIFKQKAETAEIN